MSQKIFEGYELNMRGWIVATLKELALICLINAARLNNWHINLRF